MCFKLSCKPYKLLFIFLAPFYFRMGEIVCKVVNEVLNVLFVTLQVVHSFFYGTMILLMLVVLCSGVTRHHDVWVFWWLFSFTKRYLSFFTPAISFWLVTALFIFCLASSKVIGSLSTVTGASFFITTSQECMFSDRVLKIFRNALISFCSSYLQFSLQTLL